MKTKICSRCKEEKSITEFHHSRGLYRKDGLQRYCKDCCNLAQLQWRQTHKELVKGYGQKYYQNHKEQFKERQGHYRATARGKYSMLRGHARQSILFTLEKFEVWYDQQEKICYYCGRKLICARAKRELDSLNIDRKDNNLSYTLDNMALSCRRCNIMKGSWLTETQMLDAAKRYFIEGSQILG